MVDGCHGLGILLAPDGDLFSGTVLIMGPWVPRLDRMGDRLFDGRGGTSLLGCQLNCPMAPVHRRLSVVVIKKVIAQSESAAIAFSTYILNRPLAVEGVAPHQSAIKLWLRVQALCRHDYCVGPQVMVFVKFFIGDVDVSRPQLRDFGGERERKDHT